MPSDGRNSLRGSSQGSYYDLISGKNVNISDVTKPLSPTPAYKPTARLNAGGVRLPRPGTGSREMLTAAARFMTPSIITEGPIDPREDLAGAGLQAAELMGGPLFGKFAKGAKAGRHVNPRTAGKQARQRVAGGKGGTGTQANREAKRQEELRARQSSRSRSQENRRQASQDEAARRTAEETKYELVQAGTNPPVPRTGPQMGTYEVPTLGGPAQPALPPPTAGQVAARGSRGGAATTRSGAGQPSRRERRQAEREANRPTRDANFRVTEGPGAGSGGLSTKAKVGFLIGAGGATAGAMYMLTPEEEAMNVSPSGQVPPSKTPSANKTAKKTNQVKPKTTAKPKATAKPATTQKPAVQKPAVQKPAATQQSAPAPVKVPKSVISLRSSTLQTPGFNIDTSDYQDTFMVGPSPNPNPTPKPPASNNKGKSSGGIGTFIMPEETTDPNHVGHFVMPPTDLVKSKVGNYHDLSEYYKRAKKSGRAESYAAFGARALTRGVANTLQFLGDKIGY